MTHLTSDELRDFQARGVNRQRVIAHLAECDECSGQLAEAVRLQPVDSGDAPDVSPYVPSGYSAYGSVNRGKWRKSLFAAAAVAAAVLIFVLLPRGGGVPGERVGPSPAETRGADIVLSSPAERASLPMTFTWASPVNASVYRIELATDAETVATFTSTDERLVVTSGNFTMGRRYRWRVIALDATGQPLAQSAWRDFQLVP